ncbi:unnamed protein product [Adineta ricciae]|uniref:Uncharacterized protein n=1 Tax=Adineta ricciae TaxID=249248 RepID=A0A816AIM9_ADIRI|nr:unnamed protein product [Adineta ricciae]
MIGDNLASNKYNHGYPGNQATINAFYPMNNQQFNRYPCFTSDQHMHNLVQNITPLRQQTVTSDAGQSLTNPTAHPSCDDKLAE